MANKRKIPIIFWNDDSGPKAETPEILKQGHTRIRTGFFDFYSFPLLGSVLFVTAVCGYGAKAIAHFFIAGEFALNSLICGAMMFALYRTVMNIQSMRHAAKILRNIELTAQHTEVRIEDVNALHKQVLDKGHVIDTKYLATAIDRMLIYGSFTFNHEEARLLKTKIGSRCAHARSSVGFLSGLLIMMGLLGTYIGLLHTIDEVGKAMAGMANIGGGGDASGGGSGLSDDQMSGFIGSIAAPLQGMGLAFSASLFGIGGSLIVAYFNYLSGHIQNDFMENTSRWIDENIPSAGHAGEKASADGRIPSGSDLKPWLAAFAQVSQRTHKKLGQLIVVMSQTVRLIAQQKAAADQVGANQAEISSSLSSIAQHLLEFKSQSTEVAVKSEQHLRSVNESISNLNTSFKSASGAMAADLKTLKASIDEKLSAVTAGATVPVVKGEEDVANLVWQLNSLLDEMDKGNADEIAHLFKDKKQPPQA